MDLNSVKWFFLRFNMKNKNTAASTFEIYKITIEDLLKSEIAQEDFN